MPKSKPNNSFELQNVYHSLPDLIECFRRAGSALGKDGRLDPERHSFQIFVPENQNDEQTRKTS